MLCQVYRSPRRQETYLYVEKSQGLAHVPEALLAQFGAPEEVMILLLDESRKLARVDAARVRESIRDQGFFLQLPPSPAELLAGSADHA